MSTYISNRNSNGLTDENGHFRLPLKLVEGEILEGLELKAQSAASMNITITAGEAKIPYTNYSYAVWSDSDVTVPIATSSSTGNRIDRVVAYVDRSMTFSASTVNHPNGLKFMVVAGTAGASPVAPSNSTVQSAVGSSNPYIDLGQVYVPMGATIITSSNIRTTGRVNMSLSQKLQNTNITTVNGTNIQFAIINEGQSLPSPIPNTTLVVLVAKG